MLAENRTEYFTDLLEQLTRNYILEFDSAFAREDFEECNAIEREHDIGMMSLGVNPDVFHEYLCEMENGSSLRECIDQYVSEHVVSHSGFIQIFRF